MHGRQYIVECGNALAEESENNRYSLENNYQENAINSCYLEEGAPKPAQQREQKMYIFYLTRTNRCLFYSLGGTPKLLKHTNNVVMELLTLLWLRCVF